jgi:hypothetical protein
MAADHRELRRHDFRHQLFAQLVDHLAYGFRQHAEPFAHAGTSNSGRVLGHILRSGREARIRGWRGMDQHIRMYPTG